MNKLSLRGFKPLNHDFELRPVVYSVDATINIETSERSAHASVPNPDQIRWVRSSDSLPVS